jgi:hypothetical protein
MQLLFKLVKFVRDLLNPAELVLAIDFDGRLEQLNECFTIPIIDCLDNSLSPCCKRVRHL